MALSDPYANIADYRGEVTVTIDSGSNAAINSDLVAVSRWIDHRLSRFFNVDTNSVTTRVYIVPAGRRMRTPPIDWAESENPYMYGTWVRLLEVDDIANTQGLEIKIDANRTGSFTSITALTAADFELRPINAPQGPEPKPYQRVAIPEWSSLGGWHAGERVQINAIHGWPAVPAAIRRATIDITATMRTGQDRAQISAGGGVRRLAVSGGLSVDYGATDAAAKAHQEMVDSLMREYGRARRFL